jgi:serine/threonine protein kinase
MSEKTQGRSQIGQWQLGRMLGEGASSQVRLANHAVTGQTAAIKIVSKKSAAMKQSKQIATLDQAACDSSSTEARQISYGIGREAVIMKVIAHPNIVSLYDVWESHDELWVSKEEALTELLANPVT